MRAEQRARAADVVAVAVAEDEQVEAPLAAAAQQRHEDALAGVALARVPRPAVEEQRVPARAHEDGGALADVGGDDVEGAVGGNDRGGTSNARASGIARSLARHGSGTTTSSGREQAGELRPPRSRPATVQTAPGQAARRASSASSACTTSAPSDQSGASATPASASGVMTSVTTGIATRLAMKPTSDTCWKKTSVSGVRPSVAIDLRAQAAARGGDEPCRPGAPAGGGAGRRVAAQRSSPPTTPSAGRRP